MASLIDIINGIVADVTKEVHTALISNQGSIEAAALSKVFPVIQDEVEHLYEGIIDSFYDDYGPRYYLRSHSLYGIMDVNVEGNDVVVDFHPEKMTPFRKGGATEDGIYTLVFRKGYHGGAPLSDPYYRIPLGKWWNRSRRASASTPPLAEVQRQIQPYLSGPAHTLFENACREHIRNVLGRIGG